jgi:hypothetical protein
VSAAAVLHRPVLRFHWHYFGTGDVRLHGVVHSAVKTAADFMCYAKLWELQHSPRPEELAGRPPATPRARAAAAGLGPLQP